MGQELMNAENKTGATLCDGNSNESKLPVQDKHILWPDPDLVYILRVMLLSNQWYSGIEWVWSQTHFSVLAEVVLRKGGVAAAHQQSQLNNFKLNKRLLITVQA